MHLLDNVVLWNAFRAALDWLFGMYRKVEAQMRAFGISRSVSLLDVGCGTGQFSRCTDGDYLGIDADCRYIANAAKRFGTPRQRFVCMRLQDLKPEQQTFEVALLAEVTHHISDADARQLLAHLARVTSRCLVVVDPTIQSRGNYLGRLLTALDRGGHIRSVEAELSLIAEHFTIVKVVPMTAFFTQGIVVFAQPKRLAVAAVAGLPR